MRDNPRSHGLWEQTAPPPPETHALSGRMDADVVVVGAGYTGLSAALHLAEAGARVAVLESVEIGFGGSGRNVGLVNAGMWVLPDAVPEALGAEAGERLLAMLGHAPSLVFDLIAKHTIACDPVQAGTLHLAVGGQGVEELRQRHAQWSARGAPVRLLDAAETAAKVGGGRYDGALLDERAGTIQPLAYARGLAAAAIKAGAAIFTASPVRGAERAGTQWCVRTDGGSVTADWVVVATNAYSAGGAGAPWLQVASEIVPMPYFNIATAPLGDNLRHSILPEQQGAWDTRRVLTSFRLDAQGRLIVGSPGAMRGGGASVHRAWARRTIRRLFPQLGDVALESEWYGRIGMTADSMPRFHRLARNVIGVSGYNGRGIGTGTVFGRSLARHVLGDAADLPLPETPIEPVRLRNLKAGGYEAGAQLAHIADARF